MILNLSDLTGDNDMDASESSQRSRVSVDLLRNRISDSVKKKTVISGGTPVPPPQNKDVFSIDLESMRRKIKESTKKEFSENKPTSEKGSLKPASIENGKVSLAVLVNLKQKIHSSTSNGETNTGRPAIPAVPNNNVVVAQELPKHVQTNQIALNLPNQIRYNISRSINQNISWNKAEKAFKKNTISEMLGDLSKTIAEEIPLISVDNNLSMYCAPIWKTVNLVGFISETRKLLSDHSDVLDSLSEQNFRELYTKVRTMSKIKKDLNQIHPPERLINFIDGVYDIENQTFLESSPDYYFFTYVNAYIDELGAGNGDLFKMFMGNCTNGDYQVYQAIMEMIGYTISSYMRKAFFVLLGHSDTGKSQIGDLLVELIGSDNTISILNLNSLKDPHTTARLKGKKVCLCMDMPKSSINEEAIAMVKQITGGDLIVGERKFCDADSFENTAKLVLACNNMPNIPDIDRNEAFLKRMIIIPFENPVPIEKQIPEIAKKMASERGYIIWEALKSLNELKKRNFQFLDLNVSIDSYDLAIPSEDMQKFLDQNCIESIDSILYTDDLYNAYLKYSKRDNISIITFGQKIRRYLCNYEKKHTSRNGKTVNGYLGLKLKESF